MEAEKKLKLLQLFYAGVLADSIKNYALTEVLEHVEKTKAVEQKLAAKGQLAQLNIDSASSLFNTFSEVFGCINWNVETIDQKTIATGKSCILCAIAKKMAIPRPCNMYCINPLDALARGLGCSLTIESTLWEGSSCKFIADKVCFLNS
jgi:hypothetical protein